MGRPHLREDERGVERAADATTSHYGPGEHFLLDRLSEARAEIARLIEQRDRAALQFRAVALMSGMSDAEVDAALADDPPKEGA